ncbi:hypothetical protein ACFSCX_10590 [Bacillus salitolerans]|uniref:Uncharacterized protein n=1 Tax=Bacillus salitolerans TaxID=1437434 RepID=A0ABW4LPB7_9BACI
MNKLTYSLILLLATFGCETNVIEPIIKEPVKEQEPEVKEESPKLRCSPCLDSPEEWGGKSDQAFPEDGQFWATDRPVKKEKIAYGILGHNILLNTNMTITNYELDTTLPTIPQELPVYIQGSYPAHHKELLKTFTPYADVLEYHPSYSGIYFAGLNPLTGPMEKPTEQKILQRAKEILGELRMPDTNTSSIIQSANGGWTTIFYRSINGYKVYVDKPLIVWFDKEGSALGLAGRRRPIIEESLYPTRSPEEAWKNLRDGKGIHPYINNFAPEWNNNNDRFTITEVEVAYHEQQPTEPRQVLQPYYVFKNKEGQAIYIPAIADPYVE